MARRWTGMVGFPKISGSNHARVVTDYSKSDLLKEVASLEEYNETATLRKRRRDHPSTDAPVPQHRYMAYTRLQAGTSANTVAYPNLAPGVTQVARSGIGTGSSLSTSLTQVSSSRSKSITPVAFMSSGASISPLPQEPASALGTSMTMSMRPTSLYNPAPNTSATDWDLRNLLMMQMGYLAQSEPRVHFNMGTGLAGQQAHQILNSSTNNLNPWPEAGNRVPLQQASALQPTGQIDAQENASPSLENLGNTEDLLSLFSDVPMAFRCVFPVGLHRGD
jgi:hypothetical protein